MMKHEFEELAGYKVSTEDYNKIIEPMYMATEMNKSEFVKCINRKRFEEKTVIKEKAVFVSNGDRTPNGAYCVGLWQMQVGEPTTNIKTGKTTYTVRNTTDEEQRKIGWDRWIAGSIDINLMNRSVVLKRLDEE